MNKIYLSIPELNNILSDISDAIDDCDDNGITDAGAQLFKVFTACNNARVVGEMKKTGGAEMTRYRFDSVLSGISKAICDCDAVNQYGIGDHLFDVINALKSAAGLDEE